MNKKMLNIGCGKKKLPGFINIDIDQGADLVVDVTRGLPYNNNSVYAVFSEHFIEHITQEEGVAFLRECRRVLVNHGRLRIATPDLDYIVGVYQSEGWKTKNPEWARYGYDWVDSRAEQLNLAMREWGHKWMYNEEELVRLAVTAGLTPVGRQRFCESELPEFRGLEYREGSRLIYEFVKDRPIVKDDEPLVSILIPAFSHRYLKECLESAVAQTYRNMEIIISDDNPDSEDNIRTIEPYANSDRRVCYYRNPRNLGNGGRGNLLRCFELSKGEYIKFLNDDDLLYPECVNRMVSHLNRFPDVTLVTSHRQCIGSDGRHLPDIAATKRPVQTDSIIDGTFLATKMLETRMNFIGEPTTVMFRRSDISDSKPSIISFAGRECIANGDMTMWLNLLSKGDAAYLTDTLSCFRLHEGQGQRTDAYRQRALKGLEQIVFDGKRMGLMRPPATARKLVRKTDEPEPVLPEPAESESRRSAPRVSIIIPLFNKAEFTQRCIEAVVNNTPRGLYECIFIDNGSTDSTKEVLSCLRGDMKVIQNRENLGFAKACNQGAEAASGEYLIFLNNDTEPRAGWIEPLLTVLEKDPKVAAVGSRLLYPDGTIQHAGVVIAEDRKLSDPLVGYHVYSGKPADLPKANRMMTFQSLTAASLMLRRESFIQAGGFDEAYWNGYEDVDLCFRLSQQGGLLVYQPESVVIHHESKSGPERFVRARKNIELLHQRWRGRIKPDIIIEKDGAEVDNGAGHIRPYYPPGQTATHVPAFSQPKVVQGLTSIIILTYNQLAYTKECVESIRDNTPEAHEIIFIDNGSSDGTVAWLRTLVRDNSNHQLIENTGNLGFAKGCNQGIEAAAGEYILLLNNDVVVTENWLQGLRECHVHAPHAGIVGPMTNTISGIQKVGDPSYNAENLHAYASEFRKIYRHRRISQRRIVGFCMLFTRELVDKIGMLDETFGTGNFEDDDFCLRAEIAGYRNYIAGDVFIHHYGSRSFIGNKIDYRAAMGDNRQKYRDKWSHVDLSTPEGSALVAMGIRDQIDEVFRKGNLEDTVKIFTAGLKQCQKNYDIHLAMAGVLLESRQFQYALDILNQSIAGDEDSAALTLKGYCEEGLGHLEAAAGYAEMALSRDEAYAPAVNLKGVIAYKSEDRATAEALFEKSLSLDPGYGEPHTNLGVIRWAAGQRDQGLDLLKRGFVLAPGAHDNAILYHRAAIEAESLRDAEMLFRAAMRLRSCDRQLLYLLIDLLLMQEKNAEALDLIEEALATDGSEEGLLSAALAVREKLGSPRITSAMKDKSISLCMIVKNEEECLAKCLNSVKAVADEMIVVDTGSTDRTTDIARVFGARVLSIPWQGDFSTARNASLESASGAWVLVLDADEVIANQDIGRLRSLVSKSGKKIAYSFVTRNYSDHVVANWLANNREYPEEAGTGWFPSDKVRLFPNDKKISFENTVHELVEQSLKKAGYTIRESGIPIHHYGKLNRLKAQEKGEAYYLLGREKLGRHDSNPNAIFELAVQATELGKYEDAAELWSRLMQLRPKFDGAYIGAVTPFLEQGRFDAALASARKAIELSPGKREAVFKYGLCEYYRGSYLPAVDVLANYLAKDPEYPPVLALLALLYLIQGRRAEGVDLVSKIIRLGFNFAEYVNQEAKKLMSRGRAQDACVLLKALMDERFTSPDIQELYAESCAKRQMHTGGPE